jgi:diguanylate cyclase (GGDEF)-like protein
MAEARVIDDLAAQLDRYGSEVESQVDAILREAETNKEAIERLEILRNEQSRPAPSPESQASPQDPWGSTANETRTPAPDRRSTERGGADRRQDAERRQRIEQMTPAQIVEELYTDPLTGLYNERAFNEDLENAAWVASIDADGLGGVNDHLGHDAGDGLLKVVGIALEETGIDAYHKSGDEFYLLGDNQAELELAIGQAVQALSAQVLEANLGKVEGINITTGIGQSKNEADTAMEASKKDRADKGLRNPKGPTWGGAVLQA